MAKKKPKSDESRRNRFVGDESTMDDMTVIPAEEVSEWDLLSPEEQARLEALDAGEEVEDEDFE